MEIVGLTLAAWLAISSAFHQGLQHLQQREYAPAVAQFTLVCQQDGPGNPLLPPARLFRAQAYEALGQPAAALEDLAWLLRVEAAPSLLPAAREAYARLGGKAEALLPATGPRQVWDRFLQACGKQQYGDALALGTPVFRASVGGTPEALATWWQANEQEWTIGEVFTERLHGRATPPTAVLVLESSQDAYVRVEFVRQGGEWRLERLATLNLSTDPDGHWVRLVELGQALAAYADAQRGLFPPDLLTLAKAELVDRADLVHRAAPGAPPVAYLYCPGLGRSDADRGKLLMALPVAPDGYRTVLYTDGRVAELPEAQFAAAAMAQRWYPAGLAAAGQLTPQQEQQLRALIAQLGDEHADVRQAAREQLRQAGAAAYPLLNELRQSPDPELRLTARELLTP